MRAHATDREPWRIPVLCAWAWALSLPAGCGEGPDRSAGAGIPSGPGWLTEITDDVGLDFTHTSGATGRLLSPEIMGAGAAMFDFDGDGALDLYLTNGCGAPNRLYRQEPDGRFTDVTATSGLGDTGCGMGVAIGDVDNDGDPDVYITNYGPDALYLNRGDGTFVNATDAAGIDVDGWSCSAAFLDYDRDGFLDLYVTQYVVFDPNRRCFTRAGRPDYCGPKVFTPLHDVLLHNGGDGTFTDVSADAGIRAVAPAAGLGVVIEDLNDDGWIDLYIANDAYPNHLWLNRGDGTFDDAAVTLGAACNLNGMTEAGMGIVAADFNGDALVDLFVTHLTYETNTLYRNLGRNVGFLDVTGDSTLGPPSAPYTGFGVAAFDLELDGDDDLVVVNGRVNVLDAVPGSAAWVVSPWDVLAEPNHVYLNDGTGVFARIQDESGALGRPIEVTRGLAAGDIDDDGDIDLLLANIEGRARLYRNEAPRRGHWLAVRVVEPKLRRDAIGAKVTLQCGNRRLVRTVSRASSYLSSIDPRVHFGLGIIDRVDAIEVRWPDGERTTFPGPDVDQLVVLRRSTP